MMKRIFGGNSRKKQPTKRQPKTLKQILSDAFTRELSKNPELMKKVAFKEMGHIDLLETTDPIEQKKQEIKTKVIDEALKQINKDPALLQRFTEKQIEEIVGEVSASEGEGYSGSAIGQALEEIENFEALKERLGGTKGSTWADIIKDPTVVSSITNLLNTLISRGQPLERMVTVQVNGQVTLIPESQYKQLQQSGRVKPIGILEAPKELKKPAEPSTVVKPELPGFLQVFNLNELTWMLDLSPEEFVLQLESDLQEELPYAQFLWNFLPKSSYDVIADYIRPYKDNSQVGTYIEKLLSEEGKVWLEQVIKLRKEKSNELAR